MIRYRKGTPARAKKIGMGQPIFLRLKEFGDEKGQSTLLEDARGVPKQLEEQRRQALRDVSSIVSGKPTGFGRAEGPAGITERFFCPDKSIS
jgi:hypothetical protein